jgi:thiamine biosynthesis lipoprotein
VTRFEFKGIGTSWSIDIDEDLSPTKKEELFQKIKDRVEVFDKDYSRFREDSLVTKMSKESGEFTLPDDADLLVSSYRRFYDLTDGLLTPLIGQAISDLGYDANYSLKPGSAAPSPLWDEVMSWNKPKLSLKSPALLDFGAGGKGYLVDIISGILEKEGIESYCVDGSGDMRQRSKIGPLQVGLENPLDEKQVIGTVNILNQSICGSAGNRRKWADYHHIINPKTLSSPKEISAVWAISPTTLLSDLLTTALFFIDPEKILPHFKFEYLMVYSDSSVRKSEGFSANLFFK